MLRIFKNVYGKVESWVTNGLTTAYSETGFNRLVRNEYLGGTQYNVLLCHFTAETGSMFSKITKNGSDLLSPSSPGSRNTAYGFSHSVDHTSFTAIDISPGTSPNTYGYSTIYRTGSDTYQANIVDAMASGRPVGTSAINVLTLSEGKGLLQAPVVTTVDTTFTASVDSSTYADPGLSATITPTSATSKLLVIFNAVLGSATGGVDKTVRLKLDRDGSDILVGDTAGNRSTCTLFDYIPAAGYNANLSGMYIVDSGSTSSTTIKALIGHNSSAAANVHLNRSDTDTDQATFYARGVSQIAVFEIEGV